MYYKTYIIYIRMNIVFVIINVGNLCIYYIHLYLLKEKYINVFIAW